MKRSINGLSPAARLEFLAGLYAPFGFRKDGRRKRKGLISKTMFLELVNAP